MPASTTQSPVGQAQRGKQRLPALPHTTLLLELEMKSSGICSVYSARRTIFYLNQYSSHIRRLDDSKAFIRNSRAMRHFSNISLSLHFKAIFASAEITTSSHSGRSTFATRLNAAGIRVATIQQAMGHTNIATTIVYSNVYDKQKANVVNAI